MLMNKNILAGLADGLCFIGLGGVLGLRLWVYLLRVFLKGELSVNLFWRISYSKFIWYFMVYCFW